LLVTIILGVSLLAGMASAAKVSFTDVRVNGPGAEAKVQFMLDEAPEGFSGYAVNLTFNPSVAKVKNVEFPPWAILKVANGVGEGNELRIRAVDLKKSVQPGAKNIELATITFEGQKKGSTYLHLSRDQFDDDKGNPIPHTLVDGSFTVGDAPVATYKPSPEPTLPAPTTLASTLAGATPPGPARKVTYSATSTVVPVIGIIMGIVMISGGGYLRRR